MGTLPRPEYTWRRLPSGLATQPETWSSAAPHLHRESRIWNQEYGFKNLETRIWNREFGIENLVQLQIFLIENLDTHPNPHLY